MNREKSIALTYQRAGATATVPTREGDVESLVGDGEVRQEADLSRVVSKQAGAQRRRQRGACQPPEGLREAAVLRHQQMIVRALQVEGVEGELDTCRTDRRMRKCPKHIFVLSGMQNMAHLCKPVEFRSFQKPTSTFLSIRWNFTTTTWAFLGGSRRESLGPELYHDKSRKPAQACQQWWSQKRFALILQFIIHQAFVHEKNKEEHRRIWLKEGQLAKEFDLPTGSTGNKINVTELISKSWFNVDNGSLHPPLPWDVSIIHVQFRLCG